VADRGSPITARRLHSHLHRFFRWCVGRGIIESNPAADLPKPGSETKRDRVLTDEELRSVWKATDSFGWPFSPAIKLLILTGARRAEIGGLRWAEVRDKEFRLEGERTKNGEPLTIPLSKPAAAIVEKLPKIAKSEFVFTTNGKTPVSGWSRIKQTIDKNIEVQAVCGEREKVAVPPWTLHDLRRTVATGLQKLGVSLQVIEAILGHVAGSRAGVVGIYQRHSFDKEKAAALEAWGAQVMSLVEGKRPGKVLPMRKGKR
jgi:integrase